MTMMMMMTTEESKKKERKKEERRSSAQLSIPLLSRIFASMDSSVANGNTTRVRCSPVSHQLVISGNRKGIPQIPQISFCGRESFSLSKTRMEDVLPLLLVTPQERRPEKEEEPRGTTVSPQAC